MRKKEKNNTEYTDDIRKLEERAKKHTKQDNGNRSVNMSYSFNQQYIWSINHDSQCGALNISFPVFFIWNKIQFYFFVSRSNIIKCYITSTLINKPIRNFPAKHSLCTHSLRNYTRFPMPTFYLTYLYVCLLHSINYKCISNIIVTQNFRTHHNFIQKLFFLSLSFSDSLNFQCNFLLSICNSI